MGTNPTGSARSYSMRLFPNRTSALTAPPHPPACVHVSRTHVGGYATRYAPLCHRALCSAT
eukprot:358844-Alexandrium_andersonii.AAC.1